MCISLNPYIKFIHNLMLWKWEHIFKFDWVLISLISMRFGFVIIWKLVELKFNIYKCKVSLIMDKFFLLNKLIWFWKYNFFPFLLFKRIFIILFLVFYYWKMTMLETYLWNSLTLLYYGSDSFLIYDNLFPTFIFLRINL